MRLGDCFAHHQQGKEDPNLSRLWGTESPWRKVTDKLLTFHC